MSLLLEALKKAERAKEEAQRRAEAGAESTESAEPAASAARVELELQDETGAAPEAGRKPLMTRDQLPQISTSLEIVSDEPKPAPSAEPAQSQAPLRRREAEAAAESPQAADRATARKVFEAKFREPNPRLPFYITMAGLSVFAVGTVVYFYLQLRPPPPLVNANPPRPAAEAATPVPTVATPSAPGAPVASGPSAIPGMPSAPAVATPLPVTPRAAPLAAAPRMSATPAAPVMAQETPRLKPQPERVRSSAPAAVERAPTPAAAPARAEPQVNPKVESGYAAYLAGDTVAARKEYQQALVDDPGNRDALLGLAAIDVRTGRYDLAEAGYMRLLQANPRDTAAHAGLVALRAGRIDPLVAESRLKSLLLAEPGAHPLSFALGNLYAQQGRWAEAQQEFFKAASAEPDNADYAYNLAVSLDQLRQPRLARDYYQRAVSLADKRGASFDVAGARARLAQLAP